MKMSYWVKFPRGFANEYDVGIATSPDAAAAYAARGYERIGRATACRKINYRGNEVTVAYNTVTVDGRPYQGYARGARAIMEDIRRLLAKKGTNYHER